MTKIVYHPFIVFIITIVSVFFFFSLNKSAQKTSISTQNIKILEKEVDRMSNNIMETEEKIIKTESNEFKEKIIRNELLLQKPGEHVIQLPDLENNEDVLGNEIDESKPFDRWLKLLKM